MVVVVVAVGVVLSTAPPVCHVTVDGCTAVDTFAGIRGVSCGPETNLPADMVANAKWLHFRLESVPP